MLKSLVKNIAVLAVLFLSACSSESDIEQGVHFKKITHSLDLAVSQNYIVEFFWYGCGHCERFEPVINKWSSEQAGRVEVIKMPAIWNKPMELHARAFFLAQELPEFKQLHEELFVVIMQLRGNKNMDVQIQALAQFFSMYGVHQDDFSQRIYTPAMNEKLSHAAKLMKNAEITSTPSLIVNGEYLVLNKSASEEMTILDIAEKLLEFDNTVPVL